MEDLCIVFKQHIVPYWFQILFYIYLRDKKDAVNICSLIISFLVSWLTYRLLKFFVAILYRYTMYFNHISFPYYPLFPLLMNPCYLFFFFFLFTYFCFCTFVIRAIYWSMGNLPIMRYLPVNYWPQSPQKLLR